MSGSARRYAAVVIGTGFAREHLRLLRQLPEVRVDGLVYGHDGRRAAALAAEMGIPRVTGDPAEALGARPDFAVIVTPPDTHAGLCAAAFDAGCAVVCDKPLARDAAEAAAIAERARAAGVPAMVFFQWRFHPAARRLRELCRSGALGRLVHVEAEFFHDFLADPGAPWSWRNDLSRCGMGAFGDMGVHLVDLVLWATGEEVEVEGASGRVLRETRPAPDGPRACDAEDYGRLALRLSGGAGGGISVCRAVPGRRSIRLLVAGEAGSAELLLSPDTTAGTLQGTGAAAGSAAAASGGLANPYAAWIARLGGGEAEIPELEDGVRAQRVLDAAAEAMGAARFAGGAA